ncbi:MAG: trypsin-like peptidase domain-containing protein [Treponema sp.]|nr:trypsin-like peptidase domain-containing protein [Treponema sp.]
MKLKKILSIVFAAFAISLASAESMRDYVCVVRSNLPEKTISFLKDYRNVMEKAGYKSYAEQIDEYIKEGTFGSGFTIRANDGKLYVVTNCHVVEDAGTVNLIYENEDGSNSEYKDLKILASDEDIDIALISVPQGFSRKALTLSSRSVNDADEVWAAGFPSLKGNPMWQFSRGTVTNNRARIDELLSSDISTLIQHSADIDSGNSGGPLLMADSSVPASYSVVGINTWKAVSRDGTNFAIPAKVIDSFVSNAVSGAKKSVNIDERIKQFTNALKDEDKTFLGLAKFVSNEMISQVGDEAFLSAVRTASGSMREALMQLYAYSPVSGMRYSIAYVVWSEFQKNGKPLDVASSEPESTGENWTVKLTPQGRKELTSVWGVEQGRLRLFEFSTIRAKGTSIWERGHEDFDIADPFLIDLKGGILYPFATKKMGFNIEFEYSMYDFITFGAGFCSETVNVKKEYSSTTEEAKQNTIYVGAGLQLPLWIDSFVVIPHANVQLGFANFFDIENHSSKTVLSYGGGIKVGYIINSVCPMLTVDYMHSTYKGTLSSGNEEWPSNSLRVGIGLQVLMQ